MALFLFRGPPIYAPGQGANANIFGAVPAPVVSVTADSVPTIVWQTIADQIFTQNVSETHDLSDRVSMAGGYPLRVTLSPDSAALPEGVAWNEATKSLVATNPPTVTSVDGIILRATSGVLASVTGSVASPSVAVAADVTQPSPGTFAAVNGVVPRPIVVMTGEGAQITGMGYPTYYPTLTDREFVWSDSVDPSGWQPNGATYSLTMPPGMTPGHYVQGGNAVVKWENYGGDWWDNSGTPDADGVGASPVKQGTTAFATQTVSATGVERYINFNVTSLVKGWLSGRWRNAGFVMRAAAGGSSISWRSRHAATNPPKLILTIDGVDTTLTLGPAPSTVGRTITLDSSQSVTDAGDVRMKTSGTTSTALVWFDLSGYTGQTITNAVLSVCTYEQFTTQNTKIYRCRNRNDPQDNPPVQRLGIASKYYNDVGIEADSAAIFVQQFTDQYYYLLWRQNSYGGVSHPCDGVSNNQHAFFISTDEPEAGFTRLLNRYNAFKIIFSLIHNGAYQSWWPMWGDVTGQYAQRLMNGHDYSQPPDEAYFRFYAFLPAIGPHPYTPSPQGGKWPGFDGRFAAIDSRFPGIPGMGVGNSGSGADGALGWSYRGTYTREQIAGAPNEDLYSVGAGGDVYDLYCTNYGHAGFSWDKHYLGMVRRGEWNCFEHRIKMNTVTHPEQKPRIVDSMTSSGTTCTVVLRNVENDPLYAVGQRWATGGVAAGVNGYNYYNNVHPIASIIDNRTFTFTIPGSVNPNPSRSSTNFWACPSEANADGVVEGWVNGYLAGSFPWAKFRHTLWCQDGTTNFGIDSLWMSLYHGGGLMADNEFSMYFSNIVVATDYIGPIVTG